MPTPTKTSAHAAEIARRTVLRRHGFEFTASNWHRGDVDFREGRGWLVFTAPWPDTVDPLHTLGAFGLWKPVGDNPWRRVFAVRETWIYDGELLLAAEERSSFDRLVEWALATADGALPSGWAVPERASINACLDKSRLTLVHRGFVRQMQVLHPPDRLALRLPILPATPLLPEARLRWLRTLLLEAQTAHHLFRLGFIQEGAQTSVIAEIDMSGVPAILCEPLLSKGCDALRWVVAWLVESADFLAQADVASHALELCAAAEPNP